MTDIAAIIKVLMEPGQKTDQPASAPLRPGSMLNGRITDILPSGLLQINFGKFKTQARVKFPVARGDTLRFEVLETGDRIKLKLQDPPPTAIKAPAERLFKPEDLNLLRQHLQAVLEKPGTPGMDRGSADSTRLLLSRLINHLLPLPASGQADQLPPLIKATLANSGIFFEKRLESILLQIFKSPDRIDTGRAVTHPFVTHIFDNDLKPILLKLAAILGKPGGVREPALASIRESALKLLRQIDTAQTRLTRPAPTGAPPPTGTYHRTHSPSSGLPRAALQMLQRQLVKSGLWSAPEIRALARGVLKPAGLANGQPVNSRLNVNAPSGGTGELQKTITGFLQRPLAMPSKALGKFLKSFQAYVQENRFQLDPRTKAALIRLEALAREGSPVTGLEDRAKGLKQHLASLARFMDSRTGQTPTAAQAMDKTTPADRTGAKTVGKGLSRFSMLVEPRAAALSQELSQIDQALARLLSHDAVHPEGKPLARTIRALHALVRQHQLPAEETVNRVLTALGSRERPPKTGPAAFKSGPLSERLRLDLMLLREFIGQQQSELKEVLDTLKALMGRSAAESEPGDRPGPERARGTDPMQVIAFSLPMESGQKPARLKVFYPSKKGTSNGNGFRISLLLSMERMGSIRTDIFAHQQNLEIKFSTETEIARSHIGNHLKRLGDLLDGHFDNVNLSTAVDEKTIAAFEYEDLELSANRLVDLQA